MKSCLIPMMLSMGVFTAPAADLAQAGTSGQPAFRIRSDFGAKLNADHGWAGALNENVAIRADQPFRLRMEAEQTDSTATHSFRLQYRRNQGDWTDVEAHDFPHPEAELSLDFAGDEIGATPEGWIAAQGDAGDIVVAAVGAEKVLHVRTKQQPLISLYTPPWESKEFVLATELRFSTENRNAAALVFGYIDNQNFRRVSLDPAAGTIRVSRYVEGKEIVDVERKAEIPAGEWLEIEIEYEGTELTVNYQDDTLEFTAAIGAGILPSQLGFSLPAQSSVEFREFGIEGNAKTPRVSIVSCPAYQNGADTTNLLMGASAEFKAGAGISLFPRTPSWTALNSHGEFEWALVIRRFVDLALTNEEGDTFEFRMIDDRGQFGGLQRNPVLSLTIPPGHVGGTFVETPGRIGPWQASNGDLYFIMEPAETSNLFMMVKSTDDGRTWREVDGTNRPRTGDLESVDGRQVGDTIHIIHQVTNSTRYHAFRTSNHPTHPDTWKITDERAASASSVAQGATLVVRSDGSMVAFYVGQTIHYSVRSVSGAWGQETVIDQGARPKLAGPQAVLGSADVVHLAYYAMDGTVWYRRLLPDGTLTAKEPIASGLGTTRAEFGSVLPLLFIAEKNTAVILYRGPDGKLWERRVVNNGSPAPAVKVTDRNVVLQAVDSQQPGADAVLDGKSVHVLFIEDESRSIFSTDDQGGWQPSTQRVDNIKGSWIRGNLYTRRDGTKVLGLIYDAGSEGGAGMNRFAEIILSR